MNDVYSLHNQSLPHFIKSRNDKYAQIIAQISHKQFVGSLPESKLLTSSDTLICSYPLSTSAAEFLNIQSPAQLYGVACEPILASKLVFHSPVEGSPNLPPHFPIDFSVAMQSLVLPGYCVFTNDELLTGYQLLKNAGYEVRLKDPLASFGVNQLVIVDIQQLKQISANINWEKSRNTGLVLEANLKNPKSYSGGWVSLFNKQYSYIGEQSIGTTNTPHRYLGTKVHLVEGDISQLTPHITDPIMKKIIPKLEELKVHISKLPLLVCSRYNFDFLHGKLNGMTDMYVIEQGFDPGGASAAYLLGIQELHKSSNQKYIEAEYQVAYGKNNIIQNTKNHTKEIIYFDGIDPEYGYIHARAWID